MAGMAAVEPLREQDLDRLADELARVVAEHLLEFSFVAVIRPASSTTTMPSGAAAKRSTSVGPLESIRISSRRVQCGTQDRGRWHRSRGEGLDAAGPRRP